MEEDYFDIQYRFFVVNDKPFCLWDTDIQSLTLEFLESIDPTYYEFIADSHLEAAIEEKSKFASLVIRTAYSQGLETLFALIAATAQAPHCVPAWINSYQNKDLYSVVEKISNNQPLLSALKEEHLSWPKLSEIILSGFQIEDKEKEASIKDGFGKLWTRFAKDFLDQGFSGEYNSIKHGLRIRPGGFHLSIGVEDKPGVPAPKERMQLMGSSEFGSSYFVSEKMVDKSYHVRLRRRHRNWDPEDFSWGLHLISMSLSNIISFLRMLNGVSPEEVRFQWPSDMSAFSEPWKRSLKIGVTSMTGFQKLVPDELIEPFSRQSILTEYREGHDAGIKRFTISNEVDKGHDQQ